MATVLYKYKYGPILLILPQGKTSFRHGQPAWVGELDVPTTTRREVNHWNKDEEEVWYSVEEFRKRTRVRKTQRRHYRLSHRVSREAYEACKEEAWINRGTQEEKV